MSTTLRQSGRSKEFMSKHLEARRAVVLTLTLVASGVGYARGPACYPSRPTQLVVPFPAGWQYRSRWSHGCGKACSSIVVENRAGAGTVIGAAYVAKAPADGYTLLISSGSTFTHCVPTCRSGG